MILIELTNSRFCANVLKPRPRVAKISSSNLVEALVIVAMYKSLLITENPGGNSISLA
jgi:hypothetical protein